ncbi:hypothetical protein [Citreimonas sp.]|uniref:hypothetical protein n=1 Tax=Citreimonas sp. TaxID=3036715 RepID=UPI0035C834F6
MPLTFRAGPALISSLLFVPHAGPAGAQSTEPAAPDTVIVVEFRALDLAIDGGAVDAALALADTPHLADLDISVASGTPDAGRDGARYDLDGALVFSDLDSFSSWKEDGMTGFFDPVGGLAQVATSMRVFRPNLLAQADDGMRSGFEDVSIRYRNSGNDAAGDSDIDAVTVLCPGDHADCKPSN